MKPVNPRNIFFLFVMVTLICGCNNGKKNSIETISTNALQIDSSTNLAKADSVMGNTQNSNASDTSSEKATIPVYALWINMNKTYDGMYDSTSGYFRLCETKEVFHISDRSQIAINANNTCFSQGTFLRMVVIKKSVHAPLFLTVLDVDSSNKSVVGVTDSHDTIATSVNTLNHNSFETLKNAYRTTPFQPDEVNKIKQFYKPEMKMQNVEKKERLMRLQSEINK
jgi:hypothetical protein